MTHAPHGTPHTAAGRSTSALDRPLAHILDALGLNHHQFADEVLALVRKHPAISIPELSRELGCRQNRLYLVLPALMKDGKVKRAGRGWEATS